MADGPANIDPTGGQGGTTQAIPTTGTPPMNGPGGIANAAMPGRQPNPLMQYFGGQRIAPSAGGQGDQANAANHVNFAMAALEKALGMMDKNDRNYGQIAQMLHKLQRILPQGGTAAAGGPLQTLLAQIQNMVKQRGMQFQNMQQAGGPAQQMAQATNPQMNLGSPPPMGAFPGA